MVPTQVADPVQTLSRQHAAAFIGWSMPRRKNRPAARNTPSAPVAQDDDDDALLDSHILANQVRVKQTKQLFEAAEQGRLDEVRSLLDLGLSPDETHPKKTCTPLLMAAQSGRIGVVRELLSRRADPNARFRSNQMSTGPWPTPLFLATFQGHTEVMVELISNGAAVDAAPLGLPQPLLVALKNDADDRAIQALVEGRADLGKQWLCSEQDKTEEYWWIDTATPLLASAARNRTEITRMLLARHAPHAELALLLAASAGHAGMVNLLVDAHADVDSTKRPRWAPEGPDDLPPAIYQAAQNNHLDAVKALLAAGADVNRRCQRPFAMVEWADPSWKLTKSMQENMTAVMIAGNKGYDKIFRTLVLARADTTLETSSGQKAMDLAHQECLFMCVEADARHMDREHRGKCIYCGVTSDELGETMPRCAKCLTARYCCPEHQIAHWPKHKGDQCACMSAIREVGRTICGEHTVHLDLKVEAGGFVHANVWARPSSIFY